jgi:hypothetical protein
LVNAIPLTNNKNPAPKNEAAASFPLPGPVITISIMAIKNEMIPVIKPKRDLLFKSDIVVLH